MKIIYLFIALFLTYNLWGRESKDLRLRGEGSYTFLFLKVYKAKLWASNTLGKELYEGNLKLQLEYFMDFQGVDIVKQTVREWENAGVANKKIKRWRGLLLDLIPDVKHGDRILASYSPVDGITFFLNEKVSLGKVTSRSFSKSFLDIWLGEKSSDQTLRAKLLGLQK